MKTDITLIIAALLITILFSQSSFSEEAKPKYSDLNKFSEELIDQIRNRDLHPYLFTTDASLTNTDNRGFISEAYIKSKTIFNIPDEELSEEELRYKESMSKELAMMKYANEELSNIKIDDKGNTATLNYLHDYDLIFCKSKKPSVLYYKNDVTIKLVKIDGNWLATDILTDELNDQAQRHATYNGDLCGILILPDQSSFSEEAKPKYSDLNKFSEEFIDQMKKKDILPTHLFTKEASLRNKGQGFSIEVDIKTAAVTSTPDEELPEAALKFKERALKQLAMMKYANEKIYNIKIDDKGNTATLSYLHDHDLIFCDGKRTSVSYYKNNVTAQLVKIDGNWLATDILTKELNNQPNLPANYTGNLCD